MAATCEVCGYHLEQHDVAGRFACYGCAATILQELGNIQPLEMDLAMGGHPRVNCWCMFPAPASAPAGAHEEICRRARAALGLT